MRGLTLLELMVALVVIGIATGVSVAALASLRPSAVPPLARGLTAARTEAVEEGRTVVWHGYGTTMRFEPDGSSSGGIVGAETSAVRVDALTGQVHAAR